MPPKRKRASLRSRAKAASSPLPTSTPTLPTSTTNAESASRTRPTKKRKERRSMRHARLLNRTRDAGVQKTTTKKRRRPGKKLKAAEDVSGLRDALPDIPSLSAGGDDGADEDGEGRAGLPASSADDDAVAAGAVEGGIMMPGMRLKRRRRKAPTAAAAGEGKMGMRTLKHRPGAMKRKRKMERGEMERLGRNLAQLAGPGRNPAEAEEGDASGGGVDGGGRGGESENGVGQSEKWAALRRFIGGTMERDGRFGVGVG